MASFSFESIDGLLDQFKDLERIDEIAPKMLEESAPIVVNKLKAALSEHNQTGDMIKSIKPKKPAKDKSDRHYTFIRPTGQSKKQMTEDGKTVSRKTPERNMEKLAILEFGSSKQKATPVVANVVKATENEVIKKMEEVYYREVKIK